MSIILYHQCGHNNNWNRESYLEDGCGDGLIFSPIHQTRESIENLDDELKEVSVFDPQFYLPNSQKRKLQSYDFFPETLSGGFDTADFSFIALDAARRCVNFQMEQNFKFVIIPVRHFTDMIPDYIERQNIYTLHPFLQALDEVNCTKDVYITVSLTASMIRNRDYRVNILNWITNYPRLDGVYLLVEDNRATKQIQDSSLLIDQLRMVRELSEAGLKIIVGHQNTESLLFSLVDNCDLTFGAYENTRNFSIDKFVVSDEEVRGPRSRLYIPGLLNWIQYSQAEQIRDGLPAVWSAIYKQTKYAESAFEGAREPHFNFPGLYKHFFMCFKDQVNELSVLPINDRYELLRAWLREAQSQYEEIEDWPLDLDRHGRGDHITPWLDAINWYKREYLG